MAPLLSLLICLMPIANQPGWLAHGPLRAEGIHKRVHARWSYSRRQESEVPGRNSSLPANDESFALDNDETPNFVPSLHLLPSLGLHNGARRLIQIPCAYPSPRSHSHPQIHVLRC